MLDLFNIPTPQTANYQEFYGSATANGSQFTWVKPRGASMIRFMLIGAGGAGGNGTSTSGGTGGESGVVTSWIGPAMFVPDNLIIYCYAGATSGNAGDSSVRYYSSNRGNILLQALGGTSGGSGNATAMTANQFTACGIFTSVAGQAGAAGSSSTSGSNVAASATTFLSGGAGGAGNGSGTGGSVTPNYGYTALPVTTAGGSVAGANGYFITQPILVGCGGAGGTTSTSVGSAGGRGGIGCGGGGAGEDALTGGGRGGNGAVFIWAW
jgi:hypothetical protein